MCSARATWDSLPPCGGGMGWGVVQDGTAVPHRTTPSPQGGGEEFAIPANRSLASASRPWWKGRLPLAIAATITAAIHPATAGPAPRPYTIAGDAIPAPLTGAPGDAARGKAIVASRQTGLCLLCHSAPLPEEKFQGTIGPDLKGAGSRYTEGQLRLRIVDSSAVNPGTIMPAYYRLDGLERVAPAFRGRTVLTAEQIEDVVAFLMTLRN
jgi:L-cysteine S-thiosulfotransferase